MVQEGYTVLYCAFSKGNGSIVALLKAGANLDAQNMAQNNDENNLGGNQQRPAKILADAAAVCDRVAPRIFLKR